MMTLTAPLVPTAPKTIEVVTVEGFRDRETGDYVPSGSTISVTPVRAALLMLKGIIPPMEGLPPIPPKPPKVQPKPARRRAPAPRKVKRQVK